MDYKKIVHEIAREHPDWTAEEIKVELYRRIIKDSPAYIDDSHVFPEGTLTGEER